MKVTVVGYWGGYPDKDGATSCYLVESNGYTLALDMGSASLSKIQQFKEVEDLDAVIISHYHADHVADIGVLQYALLVRSKVLGFDKVLPIYGHRNNGSELEFEKLTHDYTKATEYNPDEILHLGPFTITFFKTKHGVPCYGMKITDGIQTLVYTADTAYDPSLASFAMNADLLITDCNFYKGMDATSSGHMTSEECAKIAEESCVGTLILSHLPQFGNLEQLRSEAEEIFSCEVLLASEGLIWDSETRFNTPIKKKSSVKLRTQDAILPTNPNRREMSVDMSTTFKEVHEMNKKALKMLAKRT